MTFAEHHSKVVQKAGNVDPRSIWIKTFIVSVIMFAFFSFYYALQGFRYDLFAINVLLGLSGMFLIGMSVALSGLTYFWNFVDTKLIYRKQLGLTGFYMVLVHAAFSFTNYFFIASSPKPEFIIDYIWRIGGLEISNWIAFFAAVLALAIFTFMALISNKYAMMEIGGMRWRSFLRIGYVAYLLIVIHFGLKRFFEWDAWISGYLGLLPPLSLVLLVFVIFVFVMRIALFISLERKKKKPSITPETSQVTTPIQSA